MRPDAACLTRVHPHSPAADSSHTRGKTRPHSPAADSNSSGNSAPMRPRRSDTDRLPISLPACMSDTPTCGVGVRVRHAAGQLGPRGASPARPRTAATQHARSALLAPYAAEYCSRAQRYLREVGTTWRAATRNPNPKHSRSPRRSAPEKTCGRGTCSQRPPGRSWKPARRTPHPAWCGPGGGSMGGQMGGRGLAGGRAGVAASTQDPRHTMQEGGRV